VTLGALYPRVNILYDSVNAFPLTSVNYVNTYSTMQILFARAFVDVWNTIDTNHKNYVCINFQKLTHLTVPQTQARTQTSRLYCIKAYISLTSVIFTTWLQNNNNSSEYLCHTYLSIPQRNPLYPSAHLHISVYSDYTYPVMQT